MDGVAKKQSNRVYTYKNGKNTAIASAVTKISISLDKPFENNYYNIIFNQFL